MHEAHVSDIKPVTGEGGVAMIERLILFLLIVLTLAASPAVFGQTPYDGTATQLAQFALAYDRARARGGVAQPNELEDIGYFKGFVSGVFVSQKWPCAREAISSEQIYAIVAKYLRENPERWGLQARDLVIEAADRVFGCKNK